MTLINGRFSIGDHALLIHQPLPHHNPIAYPYPITNPITYPYSFMHSYTNVTTNGYTYTDNDRIGHTLYPKLAIARRSSRI